MFRLLVLGAWALGNAAEEESCAGKARQELAGCVAEHVDHQRRALRRELQQSVLADPSSIADVRCVPGHVAPSIAPFQHIISHPDDRYARSPHGRFFLEVLQAILTLDQSMYSANAKLQEWCASGDTEDTRWKDAMEKSFGFIDEFNVTMTQAAVNLEALLVDDIIRLRLATGESLWSLGATLRVRLARIFRRPKIVAVNTCEQWRMAFRKSYAVLTRTANIEIWHMLLIIVHLSLFKSAEAVAQLPRVHFRGDLGFCHAQIVCNLLEELAMDTGKRSLRTVKMVEIGVNDANHAEGLLGSIPSLQYIGVDPYPHELPMEGQSYSDKEAYLAAPDKRYTDALLRIMPFAGRAHLLRMTSVQAATWIQDGILDLIWIDGLHTYESVVEDLRAWVPKLRPGGIVAGHDYGDIAPGVINAVHEVFWEHPSPNGVLDVAPDCTFFWKKQ